MSRSEFFCRIFDTLMREDKSYQSYAHKAMLIARKANEVTDKYFQPEIPAR